MPDDATLLSAQVVLWPADRTVDVDEPITAANLHRHRPDLADAETTRRAFTERGFTVGPLVGIGFSIEAPLDTFRAVFGSRADEVRRAAQAGHREGLGLDVSALPPEAEAAVRAVELTPPPDFGPGAP